MTWKELLLEIKLVLRTMFSLLFLGLATLLTMIMFIQCANADVKSVITRAAFDNGLDPAVALAVAEVESSFNPKSTGKAGEVGLFQLHPKYHNDASYNINKNSRDGVKTLLYWKKHCPYQDEMTYVLCFNRGWRPVVNPKTAPYYKKFIQSYRKHVSPQPVSPVAMQPGYPLER